MISGLILLKNWLLSQKGDKLKIILDRNAGAVILIDVKFAQIWVSSFHNKHLRARLIMWRHDGLNSEEDFQDVTTWLHPEHGCIHLIQLW